MHLKVTNAGLPHNNSGSLTLQQLDDVSNRRFRWMQAVVELVQNTVGVEHDQGLVDRDDLLGRALQPDFVVRVPPIRVKVELAAVPDDERFIWELLEMQR